MEDYQVQAIDTGGMNFYSNNYYSDNANYTVSVMKQGRTILLNL